MSAPSWIKLWRKLVTRSLILAGFIAVTAQAQSCYPEQERFNTEQSAVCKGVGGLPILVYDAQLMMPVYRGCQIPCQPAVVYPGAVEPKE
jgi:hypothetical protein